jgi:pyridoxamine 5'-phosphate oxidase
VQRDPAGADRLAGMRRSYQSSALSEADVAAGWLEQFGRWLEQAVESLAFPEPNAMVLATADANGTPSARTVLLKGYDERGLVFFTNYSSRKGRELAENPRVSVVFPWYALERQILLTGTVTRTSRADSEAYFHSRPYGSQIAASISDQSQVIPGREWLESERDRLAAQHPESVPLPDFWGGFRIEPATVEFWQGREDRLHDRLRYRRTDGDSWLIERLAP